MPQWAQILTECNPIKYFVQVMPKVMLKGAGLSDSYSKVLKTLAYTLIMNGFGGLRLQEDRPTKNRYL